MRRLLILAVALLAASAGGLASADVASANLVPCENANSLDYCIAVYYGLGGYDLVMM